MDAPYAFLAVGKNSGHYSKRDEKPREKYEKTRYQKYEKFDF